MSPYNNKLAHFLALLLLVTAISGLRQGHRNENQILAQTESSSQSVPLSTGLKVMINKEHVLYLRTTGAAWGSTTFEQHFLNPTLHGYTIKSNLHDKYVSGANYQGWLSGSDTAGDTENWKFEQLSTGLYCIQSSKYSNMYLQMVEIEGSHKVYMSADCDSDDKEWAIFTPEFPLSGSEKKYYFQNYQVEDWSLGYEVGDDKVKIVNEIDYLDVQETQTVSGITAFRIETAGKYLTAKKLVSEKYTWNTDPVGELSKFFFEQNNNDGTVCLRNAYNLRYLQVDASGSYYTTDVCTGKQKYWLWQYNPGEFRSGFADINYKMKNVYHGKWLQKQHGIMIGVSSTDSEFELQTQSPQPYVYWENLDGHDHIYCTDYKCYSKEAKAENSKFNVEFVPGSSNQICIRHWETRLYVVMSHESSGDYIVKAKRTTCGSNAIWELHR